MPPHWTLIYGTALPTANEPEATQTPKARVFGHLATIEKVLNLLKKNLDFNFITIFKV
jgi:hypothetical protein